MVKQLNDWQIKSDRHFDKNDRSIVSIQEELCKISVHEIFEKIKAEKDFINSFSQ